MIWQRDLVVCMLLIYRDIDRNNVSAFMNFRDWLYYISCVLLEIKDLG